MRLEVGNDVIIIPGDMEVAGWNALMNAPGGGIPSIVQGPTVWVAGHHGRSGAYHPGLMSALSPKPEFVIISDKPIDHATQQRRAARYKPHTNPHGVMVRQLNNHVDPAKPRHVLTTSDSGEIQIHWGTDRGVFTENKP